VVLLDCLIGYLCLVPEDSQSIIKPALFRGSLHDTAPIAKLAQQTEAKPRQKLVHAGMKKIYIK
jgi:hypothetical protein